MRAISRNGLEDNRCVGKRCDSFRRELSAVIGCTLIRPTPDWTHFFPKSACYLGQPAVTCVLVPVLDGPRVHVMDPSRLFVSLGPKSQGSTFGVGPTCAKGSRACPFVALSLPRCVLLQELQRCRQPRSCSGIKSTRSFCAMLKFSSPPLTSLSVS